MIQYLKHNEIDKVRWDICVAQSCNSLPYAYSWYLDIVSPNWDALVSDNYQAVMPLTWNKKFGFKYLYQPFFTQQLGMFYKEREDSKIVVDFIKAIPKNIRFIDIHLNYRNEFEHTDIKLRKRKNFVLDINKPYEKIFKSYDNHCQRNVKKSRKFNHRIKSVEPKDIIKFYKKHKGAETKNVSDEDYVMLEKLCAEAAKCNKIIACGVYDDNNELLAGGLFLSDTQRIIYLLGTASPKGKEARAMYALIDFMISQHCNNPITFDFEGSEIAGIARFFKGFGAEKENYFKLRLNRLPWLIRWLK